uniref:Outer membrane protein beta-barrel domain-containing protein n=1 Tax=Chryseobacterium endophyticum TaxID=1854762 RepID=A0AAU6WK05_9FLAO
MMKDAAKSFSATYSFRNDPYEKARHNLVGTDVQYTFNKDWNMSAKVYSGLSVYDEINVTKPSLAVESQYSGNYHKINLNGNYFYSTDYYPGNRRGMLQIQQNISTNINKNYSIYGNILVSNFSPKFYFLRII